VVSSARAELGLPQIVIDAGFIDGRGQGGLTDKERASFREEQLKKLEQGRESTSDIRR
jgi:hypothetical protein